MDTPHSVVTNRLVNHIKRLKEMNAHDEQKIRELQGRINERYNHLNWLHGFENEYRVAKEKEK